MGGTSDIRSLTTAAGVVDIYSRDTAFLVAVAGRYVIQIIKERGTNTTVIQMRRALDDLAARHEKFGYVAVIEPDAQLLMPADIRNGFNALVKRYSPRFTGAAIVFEKTGFHATAVRSVVTAINLASRATHPNHVFADLREGLSWLAQLTPAEPSAAGLLQIIQQLRVSMTQRT
ncbi:MAG TPA: hypothetical protein VMG12_41955 [Polyangiaceae bacterium]|nr:hypothetical protein [Polyangiaceae bacterium]